MKTHYDAIALFSGGLDSILSVKTVEAQGLRVKCIHFVSPFFGKSHLLPLWRRQFKIDIDAMDVGEQFVHMLRTGPTHGFGKYLNPCVDCKILMMRHVKELLDYYGASCVVSGEVIGQRPMSQRKDTLNIIRRESGLKEELLRPLSAQLLTPTQAELSGLIDREKLHAIHGRGRKDQMRLAKEYGIKDADIPTPAGGCRLTEQENAARYLKVLKHAPHADATYMRLAHTGRQYWSQQGEGEHWLCIGRNASNNTHLEALTETTDHVFRVRDFAGPLALARPLVKWTDTDIQNAASFVASFSPRAVQSNAEVTVSIRHGHHTHDVRVLPQRNANPSSWAEPTWKQLKAARLCPVMTL